MGFLGRSHSQPERHCTPQPAQPRGPKAGKSHLSLPCPQGGLVPPPRRSLLPWAQEAPTAPGVGGARRGRGPSSELALSPLSSEQQDSRPPREGEGQCEPTPSVRGIPRTLVSWCTRVCPRCELTPCQRTNHGVCGKGGDPGGQGVPHTGPTGQGAPLSQVYVKARGCDQGPTRRPWGLSRVQGRGGVWSLVCREGVTAHGEEGSHWGLGRGGCWAGGFEGKGGGCQEGRELSVFIFEMTLFAGGAGCLKF